MSMAWPETTSSIWTKCPSPSTFPLRRQLTRRAPSLSQFRQLDMRRPASLLFWGAMPQETSCRRCWYSKEKQPSKRNCLAGVLVSNNKKRWMDQLQMTKRIDGCYRRRPDGFFTSKKAILVMDSIRAHIIETSKDAIKYTSGDTRGPHQATPTSGQ